MQRTIDIQVYNNSANYAIKLKKAQKITVCAKILYVYSKIVRFNDISNIGIVGQRRKLGDNKS